MSDTNPQEPAIADCVQGRQRLTMARAAVAALLVLALAGASAQTYTLDTQQPQKVRCEQGSLPYSFCAISGAALYTTQAQKIPLC